MATTAAAWFVALALSLSPASGYYPFVHYLNHTAPYTPVPEKFDLSQLPAKTLTVFVSDAGPSTILFAANDSFSSVLSAIRQAAQVWNQVDTSDLRVAFGGLETPGTLQNTPGVDIVFEDQVPGVLAYTRHVAAPSPTNGPNGPFFPILRSTIHMARDLTKRPGPSSSELFFTTTVHELGHALGLQHTFTSSAMSTSVTRSTSRVRPLERDDITGVSLLYPGNGFPAGFGSIAGKVTSGGQGVHMASVVALRPNGSGVSTLTNPDGTYRIDGLPADTYWVYVHPLPPDADIYAPLDPNGQPVQPSGPIETLFYPGTRDPNSFLPITVSANNAVTGIDFSVQGRPSLSMYDVATWSFFGQNPVTPAYLASNSAAAGTMVATGVGITSGRNATPGLKVQVLGSIGQAGVRAYGPPNTVALDVTFPPDAGTGVRHLLFSLPNDIYVLPSGLHLVQKQPPQIASVTSNGDGSVTVTGSNMGPGSQVYFDGLPAPIRVPFSGNDQSGSVSVAPPPGAGGQQATVTVVNADEQDSMFVQAAAPVTYSYPSSDLPSFAIAPASLPAGTAAMVDLVANNMQFTDGPVTLGFGVTDVLVHRIWVLAPNHIVANVAVSPNAAQVASEISVVSGFQYAIQPSAFRVQEANPQLPTVALPLLNATPGQTGFYAGAYVTVWGSNLSLGPNITTVTLNDQPARVLFSSANQVNFQVPLGFSAGPAILKLNNGNATSLPLVIQIDPPPPTLVTEISR